MGKVEKEYFGMLYDLGRIDSQLGEGNSVGEQDKDWNGFC